MKEMSELRRYFENYCRELEVRYRNEFEEHLSQFASKEGGAPLILPPLCLDISQGKLDLSELESISPRSLDSSQLNSLGNINNSYPKNIQRLFNFFILVILNR